MFGTFKYLRSIQFISFRKHTPTNEYSEFQTQIRNVITLTFSPSHKPVKGIILIPVFLNFFELNILY